MSIPLRGMRIFFRLNFIDFYNNYQLPTQLPTQVQVFLFLRHFLRFPYLSPFAYLFMLLKIRFFYILLLHSIFLLQSDLIHFNIMSYTFNALHRMGLIWFRFISAFQLHFFPQVLFY